MQQLRALHLYLTVRERSDLKKKVLILALALRGVSTQSAGCIIFGPVVRQAILARSSCHGNEEGGRREGDTHCAEMARAGMRCTLQNHAANGYFRGNLPLKTPFHQISLIDLPINEVGLLVIQAPF